MVCDMYYSDISMLAAPIRMASWERSTTRRRISFPARFSRPGGELKHLSIYGDDHETADGTCVRDYIHVTDLARAHVQAVRYLRNGNGNLAANLGSGKGTSIRQVLDAIHRVTARPVPIVIQPKRPGDPPMLFADSTLASERLGFATQLSDIDNIIRTAVPFFGLTVEP